jgi:hypothetical protein
LPILLPPREASGLVARRDRCAKVLPSSHPGGGTCALRGETP